MTATLTPAEMAEHVELSIDTLRYYEKAGLMPAVHRLPNGHRRYSPSDIEWLGLVKCLRDTGMPIRHIQRYAELTFSGDETVPERVALLAEHRTNVIAQLAELQRNLDHVNEKMSYYANEFGVSAEGTDR